jgi:hypothetical protein
MSKDWEFIGKKKKLKFTLYNPIIGIIVEQSTKASAA